MSGGHLEVEVKFLVADLGTVREQLLALGAKPLKPRLFEHNVRFDRPGEPLRRKGQLLRLRRDDGARITFKGPAAADAASEAKVREELEVEVGDPETAGAILERLGYEARQVYEKYRETFLLQDVEVVLDELPFGHFVELEGQEAAIRRAAAQLNLGWERRIVDNYLSLMARLKERQGLDFEDLTFENFAGVGLSIAAVLHDHQLPRS